MAGFELNSYLERQRLRVERLLEERLASRQGPPGLIEAMAYSLRSGGKRLRPVLCLAFSEAVAGSSGSGGQQVEDAACSLEFIHTYSLIHDDLPSMDDADLRRGHPTSHKRFGEAMAILAGDALLTEAFAILSQAPNQSSEGSGAALRARLVFELATASGAGGMVGGQVLDIAEDRPAEEGYLLRLHRLKTGALIRAACRMGAMAGGGDAEALQRATAYGEAVGLAFQIADDILDVTSSNEALGKPSGADAAAGRFTFPAVLGLERSKALAAERVTQAIEAIRPLEAEEGPLAALARYTLERRS